MCLRLCALTAVVCLLVAGCAIHPLPEDISGVSTYHIVRQIRCETRQTIRQDVISWLSSLNDPLAQKLAQQYQTDPASISNFHYNLFKGPELVRVRQMAKLFYNTGIAYNFDFNISEDNNLGADVSFLKPFTHSQFTLDIAPSANRKRANERVFTSTDTFSYLLTKVPEKYCEGYVVDANYVYPITGRIGVDKLVDDFINLTLFGALAGTKAKPDGPPTMADDLKFTTTLSLSANPKIVYTPVTTAFNIMNASLTGLADRTDVHEVTVALAIDKASVADLDPVRAGLFPGASLVVGRRVIGGGTSSEKLAVAAIDQLKSREVVVVSAP
jgi:hypothetical protein